MKQPKWMWKYGEFEIFHNMLVHTRRQEFGIEYPTMWQISGISPWVEFTTNVDIEKPGYINAKIHGTGFVSIDNKRFPCGTDVVIPEGKHKVNIRVMNTSGLPCAYADSDVCPSGEDWCTVLSMHLDKHHSTAIPVGCTPAYYSREADPEIFAFEYETRHPVSSKKVEGGMLYDFGRETMGKLHIDGTDGRKIGVYFGESPEEALDTEHTYIKMQIDGSDNHCLCSVAFRYVYINSKDAENYKVYYDYEYLPVKQRGSFTSSDERINKIWDVSAYTFQLNSREFYFDGIKRDRWVWSGDAYQSYMVNNYLNFDRDIVKRTIIALRGKDPVEQHINTITDYSFYWIISVMNYYSYTGDMDFVKLMFPRMQSLMTFCETRKNADGFVEGIDGDWVFIDWSDLDKEGAPCAEQMLMYQAYKTLAQAAKLLDKPYEEYEKTADKLKADINKFYWDEEKGAFIDSYSSGKRNVTRHANIFAIMYDFATESQLESIVKNVILNDEITQITTPYFKFFELDTMCKIGNKDYVEDMISSYWGGMIELGATSIWETFEPDLSGAEHYGMYNKKYAKSLCHAWGAGPVYLLGRYWLGVYATATGYSNFNVEPYVGGFEYIEGTVPVEGGDVYVYADKDKVTVRSEVDGGTLIWKGREYNIEAGKEITVG